MKRHEFQFRIEGHGVTPRTVDFRDLRAVLEDLESAIAATAVARGAEASGDLSISLIAITEGSDLCTLAVSEPMFHAAEAVVAGIEEDDFTGLPIEAHRFLHKLWRRADAKKWTFRIFGSNGFGTAQIGPERQLGVIRPGALVGRTVVYGKLDRIGGEVNPTASLLIPRKGKTTVRLASAELARELADSLFKSIGLEGEAHWNGESWDLDDFRADRLVGVYEPANAVSAFNRLAVAAGHAWDDVDPEEFVRELRTDD